MKESTKLKIQSTTVTLSNKKSSLSAFSPRNEKRTLNIPGGAQEDGITQVTTKEKQKTFTNVAFPIGFTPSQCELLASRQRISNYLYFKANDSQENLSYKNGLVKTTGNTSSTRTTDDFKPSPRHENEVQGAKYPGHCWPSSGRESSAKKTRFFKWKSKEEIAKCLSAHAHARLLWIQEAQKMNAVISERGNHFSNGRTSEDKPRLPPQNPVYLFNKFSS